MAINLTLPIIVARQGRVFSLLCASAPACQFTQ